jgi:hypothetical protein
MLKDSDPLPDGEKRDPMDSVWRLLGRKPRDLPYIPTLLRGKKEAEEKREEQERRREQGEDFNDDLRGGRRATPRLIDNVAAGCAFIAETLAQGGANLIGEPQWHDMMTVACYCADPEATARRLCQGSQYYDPTDTMMKLAEARRARERDKKIGFPLCATLQADGAPQCATCPYLKYGKSPLNTPEANGKAGGFAEEEANYGIIPEPVGPDGEYQPIPGGYYETSDENIERMNGRICRVTEGADTLLYENMGPRGYHWRRPQGVEIAWGGARMLLAEGNGRRQTKPLTLCQWWANHPKQLPPALPVFKPNESPGRIGGNEFNMWGDWSVQPDPNYDIKDPNSEVRIIIIIDHIRNVLCRRQRDRFEYVVKWLAWKVQHPEERPETAIVFRSGPEGTGKNMVMDMYAELFGAHGTVFGDKRAVIGEHATNEYLCVGVIDEALFHGDKQTTDMMKSLITGKTRVINPKFRDQRPIKNMAGFIIHSNHDIVVTLGSHARRHVVLDVDESKIGDLAYFDRLQAAMENGGRGQFLHFLKNCELANWHPRRIIHTEETTSHQIAGMGATLKWLLDGSASGKLLGDVITPQIRFDAYVVDDGKGGWKYQSGECVPLDHYAPTETMFAMFLGWAKSTRVRDLDATNMVEFGRKMTKVLGPHTRLSVMGRSSGGQGKKERPWVYKLPDADDLRDRVHKFWGIK